jgi:hypothetical protein
MVNISMTALQFVAYRFRVHPRCLESFDCDKFVLTCLVDESADQRHIGLHWEISCQVGHVEFSFTA